MFARCCEDASGGCCSFKITQDGANASSPSAARPGRPGSAGSLIEEIREEVMKVGTEAEEAPADSARSTICDKSAQSTAQKGAAARYDISARDVCAAAASGTAASPSQLIPSELDLPDAPAVRMTTLSLDACDDMAYCAVGLLCHILVTVPLAFVAFGFEVFRSIATAFIYHPAAAFRNPFSILIAWISGWFALVIGLPFSVLFFSYDMPLQVAAAHDFWLVEALLRFVPWPSGRSSKLGSLAKAGCFEQVRHCARMCAAEDDALVQCRRVSKHFWQVICRTPLPHKKDADQFVSDLIRTHHAQGLDLDLVSALGNTLLHVSALFCFPAAMELALQMGADPNRLDLNGGCALHFVSLSKMFAFATWSYCVRHRDYGRCARALMADLRTNPCVLGDGALFKGDTPLSFAAKLKAPKAVIDALLPTISWDKIESTLAGVAPDERARSLVALLEATWSAESNACNRQSDGPHSNYSASPIPPYKLHLVDLLFSHVCAKAVPKSERSKILSQRRRQLWALLLRPMLDIALQRKLSKQEKDLMLYAWESSGCHVEARAEYIEDMQEKVAEITPRNVVKNTFE